jgi:NADH-quinone oxidoreductase subunit I
VRDSDGRVRCVACQLCEFICPPRAIKIIPGEIPPSDRFAKVEKFPEEFDIDMIRCIYCGMCEEVCPEQAIFSAQRLRHHRLHARRHVASQGKTSRDRRSNARRGAQMERKK